MTWMQVEAYLETDDRCVVPLGSTEQHAYISLATDSTLADRVAVMTQGRIVEQGATSEVLSNPAHTYTKELMEALL